MRAARQPRTARTTRVRSDDIDWTEVLNLQIDLELYANEARQASFSDLATGNAVGLFRNIAGNRYSVRFLGFSLHTETIPSVPSDLAVIWGQSTEEDRETLYRIQRECILSQLPADTAKRAADIVRESIEAAGERTHPTWMLDLLKNHYEPAARRGRLYPPGSIYKRTPQHPPLVE